MTEIRALIADDEPLARRGIRQLLEAYGDVIVAGECRNGRETLRALHSLAPDLVFLDVQMPQLDGFEVLRAFGAQRMPAVVFVTAYDEFAVRAFEAHALDYLVKPVTGARFAEAMRHVRERLRSDRAVELARKLEALLATREGGGWRADGGETLQASRPVRRLVVPTANADLVLDAAEIDWIQAEDYYAAVYALGKRHLLRESLASLEERLDPTRFVRVHRSAIVNLDRVRELRSTGLGEWVVVLRDGTRVPVSRRRREQVADVIRRSGG
ncbi:MAG: LytR/AlgR family response regulator transcription factor [Gemmatimonadaceae bacterium]